MTGTNDTQRNAITGVINLKATGITAIFTPNQQQFYVTAIRLVVNAATALTIGASLSVGTTAGSNTDLCASLVTGLTGLNTCLDMTMLSARPVIQAGIPINVNVGLAATGTSGTLTVIIEGFYL